MLVQQYLLTHSLSDLETLHGVKARVCDRGHKVSLNYDQIEAKDEDPIAQECRGLILSPVLGSVQSVAPLGETIVLARPFQRFFNLGQGAAAPVDFDHPETRFYEKLDGTLTLLYFDPVVSEWHVATRSVPEANLPIDGFGDFTFRTLFERAVVDTTGLDFNSFVRFLDVQTTYIFELTTPLNRIVVNYEDYKVYLLGARANSTGAEFDPVQIAPALRVPHAPIYRFGSVSEMVDFVSSRNPQNYEGVVVCDPHWRRVKVKNPGYLALNKVRDSVMNSPRGLVELILLEKLDDALSLFPEHIQKRAIELQDSFRKLVSSYRELFELCLAEVDAWNWKQDWKHEKGSKEHRKQFALAVQAHKGWMAPMMDQYQGRSSGLVDWMLSKRGVDGGWSNSFLDTVLGQIEKA